MKLVFFAGVAAAIRLTGSPSVSAGPRRVSDAADGGEPTPKPTIPFLRADWIDGQSPTPAPPLPGLTALTGSACLAAHQAGVVDELVHLASVRGQARAQGRGQGYASRAPGRRWRACPALRATSCARAPYYAPPVAREAAWATCGDWISGLRSRSDVAHHTPDRHRLQCHH